MRELNNTEQTLVAFICEARNKAAMASAAYPAGAKERVDIWMNCSALIGAFVVKLYGGFTEIDETLRQAQNAN